MKSLVIILLFLLPAATHAQTRDLDSLFKNKLISNAEYNKRVLERIRDSIRAVSTGSSGLPTGTSSQYFRGDKTLATFPTNVSSFTNDAGYVNAAALAAKQDTLPTGTTAQYYRGNKTLATFPTNVSIFTNDAGYATTSAVAAKLDTAYSGAVRLASDFTTSSTTAVNTNLSFPIKANETYEVQVFGHVAKATTNTGLKIAVGAPSGCTITGTEFRPGAAYSTALTNGEITAINTLGGTMATGAGVKVPFRMEFTVSNGSTAGNITIQLATVTSNTATMYASSRLIYFKSKAQ